MEGFQIDTPEPLATGTKIYPKDVINHVLLVWAVDYIPHSPTQYNDGSDPKKPCDVVVVDVVDLDQVDEDGELGLVSRGSWWRQGRLIQRLKGRVGKPNPMIGRMAKGVGANGAFELIDLSADAKAVSRANAWWMKNQDFTVTPYGDESPQQPQHIVAATTPPPPPSTLEQQANQSLGLTHNQESALDRLRRMGSQATRQSNDLPPF